MVTIYFNNARQRTLEQIENYREGAWVHVESPDEAELIMLAKDLGLELDLLRDAIDPNESPRIEREGDVTYIFTRYCQSNNNSITTVPMLIIYTPKQLITVSSRHFNRLKLFTEQKIDFLTTQKTKLLLQLLMQVTQSYTRKLNTISKQIWQIRNQLNKAEIKDQDFVRFIDIEETLNDFVSALAPTNTILRNLLASSDIKFYEQDKDIIEDLSLSSAELIELSKSRLKTITNVREAYSTIMANSLNRVFKLMTSITILMSIFTMVTGVYSMNIALPGAKNQKVFWVILGVTTTAIVWVAALFRRKRWF